VQAEGDVAEDAAEGGEEGDPALAEVVVDQIVGEGGEEVPDEGGEEEEGDDGVGYVVVWFNLATLGSGSKSKT